MSRFQMKVYPKGRSACLPVGQARRLTLTGTGPTSPALQTGVKGHNTMKLPCREAPPFRAESFTFINDFYFLTNPYFCATSLNPGSAPSIIFFSTQ